jgi:hypothetical protein
MEPVSYNVFSGETEQRLQILVDGRRVIEICYDPTNNVICVDDDQERIYRVKNINITARKILSYLGIERWVKFLVSDIVGDEVAENIIDEPVWDVIISQIFIIIADYP